jgi:flagellar biosynthesis/type III secretory pathway protein FliH
LPERVTDIFSRLRNVREEDKLKSWSTALMTYYFAVQGKVQETFDTLLHALKTLYNIREAENMTTTFLESWLEEGIARGKTEGRTEGKAEGKIEAALTFLESRFGEVPTGIRKKLTGLRDDRRVEEMLKLAATCQSLKEFQKAL